MTQEKEPINIIVKAFIFLIGALILLFAFVPFKGNLVYPELHPGSFWNWLGLAITFACFISPSGIWWAWLPEEKQPNVSFGIGIAIVGIAIVGISLLFS